MKTQLYIILLLCFGMLKISAQTYEEQYLQEEQTRLNKVQIIENEIQTFIQQNIDSYDFTDVVNYVNSIKDEDGNSLSGNLYDEALLLAKKHKLKDIFFQNNPEKIQYYYSTTIKQQCVNGGFESNGGSTAGFNFFTNKFDGAIPPSTNPVWQLWQNNPFGVLSVSPTTKATLVDTSITDPLVGIPRVNTGRYAIRLNNDNYELRYYHVTKLTRQFVVNENSISFAFALVLKDGGNEHISTNTNPYYQVKLTNHIGNVVFERRVMANSANPLFQIQSGTNILFTNWLCERINTSNFMGQTLTLDIILGDCGRGGHWGYGYFDDFCGFECTLPSFNPGITLNPIRQQNCPDLPLQITGNIGLPSDASFTNVTLQVLDTSNNVISTQIITSAPGGSFSTLLDYNNFYPGPSNNTDFNIRATLNYTINGIPQTPIIVNHTNPPGPDISFKNCPIPCKEEWTFLTNQPITTSSIFQAACCIFSSSAIYPNIDVEFRAAYEIILTPNTNGSTGFYATSTQSGKFHAYIAPCDEGDSYPNQGRQSKIFTENASNNSDIKIFPNPASKFITIDSGNEKITSWELFDISGRSVLKGSSTEVNVQNLPKANYLLNININNKITTKKVIVK